MLLWVPEPVWKTTSGKWSKSFPLVTYHESAYADSISSTYLICSLLDCVANLRVEPVLHIDCGCSLLQNTKSLDQGWRKSLSGASNVKVHERPLRLCAPVPVHRDLQVAKSVSFLSERGHGSSGAGEESSLSGPSESLRLNLPRIKFRGKPFGLSRRTRMSEDCPSDIKRWRDMEASAANRTYDRSTLQGIHKFGEDGYLRKKAAF